MKYRIALVDAGTVMGVHSWDGLVEDLDRARLWDDEQDALAACELLNSDLGVMDQFHCYRVQPVPEQA
jgi:hypothetical protein